MLRYILLTGWLCLLLASPARSQLDTVCNPAENLEVAQGTVNFNFGSVTNAFNLNTKQDFTVGQPLTARYQSQQRTMEHGFWARLYMPPTAPVTLASQGDFPDRVLLEWEIDPLSAAPSDGYVILRDGAFLGEVESGVSQYIDFNVQAGEFYEYSVYGRNQFGNGARGHAVGFVNPNGTVTGKLESFSGNPVANAYVTLTPTIGRSLRFDGANDNLCIDYHEALPANMWTLSAFVQIGDGNDGSGIVDFGSDMNRNFWLHTLPAGQGKGIVAGIGDGSMATTIAYEFEEDPNAWHQVSVVYNGSTMLLYVDGRYATSTPASIDSRPARFTIGSRRDNDGFFSGKIDDVRLYNMPLNSTDIFLTKDLTVSKAAEGLVAYWKFDEGLGTKVFDLTDNSMDALIYGAQFDGDTPDLKNAGFTDEGGFYVVEGVNYSEEQTFTARPVKNFYSHYALEFNAAYEAYATLTDFDLPDTATVEILVHPFEMNARQTLLSKGEGDFELWLEDATYKLTINGQTQVLGPAASRYQHLSLGLNTGTATVSYYLDGEPQGDIPFANLSGDWTGSPWQLAARSAPAQDFFTGLIDEVAFYDTTLTLPVIQLNASPVQSAGTDVGNPNLLSYFPLDEGGDTSIFDFGPQMSGEGQLINGSFSIIAFRQEATPNAFQPNVRVVNINPSATAVGNVDFVNNSTVTIAGVIRFEDTFCFQDSVEILVNGSSYFPRIFTDEEGRFVADFEPGSNVVLTPVYDEHLFSPGFFEARRLISPIGGVLFQNQTKRQIRGQMAGGDCRLSVIPDGAVVKVKAAALNGCYSQEITIDNPAGNFSFNNLPPVPMAVSVTQHSNNVIYDYFQLQGGQETDLRLIEADTIDFIYVAPPNVEIAPFPETGCPGSGVAFIEQSMPTNNYREYTTDIRVFERYDGGDCYLDSFNLVINNEIADADEYEIQSDTSTYPLRYFAGIPNIVPPYTKILQVTAEVDGSQATEIAEVVIIGEKSRESTFTTASPAMPLLILRDPPGDGSFASVAEGSTTCTNWSNATLFNAENNLETNIDLGAKVTTYAGTPFGGVITETEQIAEVDITASISAGTTETNSSELCVTVDKSYSTSSADNILYGDADVYVGAAVNFEFSSTDVLKYDPENCEFFLDNNLRVWPEGFGTKYVYSEWQIKKDVIPSLLLIGDTTSAKAWENILTYNQELKDAAKFRENITFDGLTEYSETITAVESVETEFAFEFAWEAGYNTTLGFEIFEVGTTVSMGFTIGGGEEFSTTTSEETSREVSFTLADDDLNDNFTIDIADDPIFGTPVFKLKSGESKCPWEPGTLNREEVSFSINQLSAINVPENDLAVFEVTAANTGGAEGVSNDPSVFLVGLVPDSNPNGAAFSLSGGDVTAAPFEFQLFPGESVDLLFAIERGPEEYVYEDMGVFIASGCQWEHSFDVGYDLSAAQDPDASDTQGQYQTSDLTKFYKEFRIDVEYLEPCSPIDISFPLQDWVMTPDDGNIMSITLNDYINDDPDLELVRVQYRRTGGDGAWINIEELPASEFANAPVFKIVQWDMTELVDGPYEIRAITQCFDGSLNPGISRVIKGRKETRPPEVFGTPQPADQVLSPGDEISITFTKRINCNEIFQADGIGTNINNNNLGLYDATTGQLVDAIITCNEDKIIVVPNVPNQFIENRVLRVQVEAIKDLVGNELEEPAVWEFLVNRSTLYWAGGPVVEAMQEGESLSVTRLIRNQGGFAMDYTIGNVPDWMEVYPNTGTVQPGSSVEITFEFPAELVAQIYEHELIMSTSEGEEPLDVQLRVTCPGPSWFINPADFTYSMNMTLELDIEGEVSADKMDMVGAFINGQLAGFGYVEAAEELDRHLVFLTIFSNELEPGMVSFQVWDASDCLLYGDILESFDFEADGLIGTPLSPQSLQTNALVQRNVGLVPGWNWISYNVELADPSINTALGSLTAPGGGLIKGQSAFSQYFSGGGSWIGSLSEVSHLTMYQYRSQALDSVQFLGAPVDPGSISLPLEAGWNWIGYLPRQGMSVNDALSSLTPLNGDVIKGQATFAQYVAGAGWVGNLNFMAPGRGYLLNLSFPDELSYPSNLTGGANTERSVSIAGRSYTGGRHWEVDPYAYEHSMNLIAVVQSEALDNCLKEGDEVGAFVDGVVRGSNQPVYVPALDAYLLFLTIYSNTEGGELLSFQWYDAATGTEHPINEEYTFISNRLEGSVDAPEILTLSGLSDIDEYPSGLSLRVFPNPARDEVNIAFTAAAAGEGRLRITDVLGRLVYEEQASVAPGANRLQLSLSGMPAGLYTVMLLHEGHHSSQLLELH
mgnify:FL=1